MAPPPNRVKAIGWGKGVFWNFNICFILSDSPFHGVSKMHKIFEIGSAVQKLCPIPRKGI